MSRSSSIFGNVLKKNQTDLSCKVGGLKFLFLFILNACTSRNNRGKAWVNVVLSWQHCFSNGQLKKGSSLLKSIKIASTDVIKDSCVLLWNCIYEEIRKKGTGGRRTHISKNLIHANFLKCSNGKEDKKYVIYRTVQQFIVHLIQTY